MGLWTEVRIGDSLDLIEPTCQPLHPGQAGHVQSLVFVSHDAGFVQRWECVGACQCEQKLRWCFGRPGLHFTPNVCSCVSACGFLAYRTMCALIYGNIDKQYLAKWNLNAVYMLVHGYICFAKVFGSLSEIQSGGGGGATSRCSRLGLA